MPRLAMKVLSATVYRRLVVMQLSLDQPIAPVVPRVPVLVEPLREADVDDYVRFRPGVEAREVQRWLGSASRCFVARHRGRIVHAGWVSTRAGWIEYLGCEIPLRAGDAYQWDSFTDPEFRRLGIASARVAAMAEALRQEGCRRLIACVLPENASAFPPLVRVGYRPAGRISALRIGPWRRVWRLADQSDSAPHGYWDGVLDEMLATRPIEAWRAYMQHVYVELMRRWLPPSPQGLGLKTDLFEEAVTAHEVFSALGPGSVGLDVSPAITAAARRRLAVREEGHLFVVGDLRQVPLRSGSMARVLAGSSLDHYADKADIAASLAELARLLIPGGILLLTLDNPHNPIVWVRNHLPFGLLNRIGLVPYYVGATYGRAEARRHLEALGFRVTDIAAIAHAPRAPAIWLPALADRRVAGLSPARLERALWALESLGRWPTRNWTGYYLALRAEKRTARDRARTEA